MHFSRNEEGVRRCHASLIGFFLGGGGGEGKEGEGLKKKSVAFFLGWGGMSYFSHAAAASE